METMHSTDGDDNTSVGSLQSLDNCNEELFVVPLSPTSTTRLQALPRYAMDVQNDQHTKFVSVLNEVQPARKKIRGKFPNDLETYNPTTIFKHMAEYHPIDCDYIKNQIGYVPTTTEAVVQVTCGKIGLLPLITLSE